MIGSFIYLYNIYVDRYLLYFYAVMILCLFYETRNEAKWQFLALQL